MQTKQAKEIIKHEVATNGVITDKAMRLYCEHRISKTTFNKLVQDGKTIHIKRQKAATQYTRC